MNDLDKATSLTPSEIVALLATNHSLRQEVDQLTHQLNWLKRQLFGRKSERRLIEQNAKQMSLGEALDDKVPANTKVATQTVKAHTRRLPCHDIMDEPPKERGFKFDETVPVEEIALPNPKVDGLLPEDYDIIGEKVSYRLAQRPGAYVVLKYVRKVVKRKDTAEISCPKAPASVIEKSYADVSFIAGLIVDKLAYHLPLYRQHQRLALNGITLARSTLTNLFHRTGFLLSPIHQAQVTSIISGDRVVMDETPIKAGRKGKGVMRQGYYWPIYGEADEIAFLYSPSHAHAFVQATLKEFKGTLLSDGYAAYARYAKRRSDITHALCWAHTRRGFVKAEEAEPRSAAIALDYIGALYEIEAQIRQEELIGEKKRLYRVEHSKPIVEGFFAWADKQMQATGLLPTNPLTKALAYALERRAGLAVFLEDPDIPLDTNHLERALRVIPMGRKNWLFCWTEVGAQYVGVLQSLISTCRLHDINPYDYLVDVLQRIDTHPAAKVHELTPRLWKEKFADNPLRSPLYALGP